MPAILTRTSRSTWTTSAWGCPAIDPANPQAGPDASAPLQALLNLGQSSALTVIVDQPLLITQVKVYTGTTIRGLYSGCFRPSGATAPTTGLWCTATLASGQTSAIVNAHQVSNYNAASPGSSPLTPANIVDQDIALFDLFIDGQKRAGRPVPGLPIDLLGIRNLLIDNLCIYDPPLFHTRFSNGEWLSFRHIRLLDPLYFQGTFANPSNHTDGLHFFGPIDDLDIDGAFITAGDDAIALNGCDSLMSSGRTTTIYPKIYYGHIRRVTATNIHVFNSSDVVRFMIGYDVPNNLPAQKNRIEGVKVCNVTGSVLQGAVQAAKYPGEGDGDTIAGVVLENWDLTITAPTGSGPPCGLQLGQNINDITIRNFSYRDVQSNSIAHQINVTGTPTIGQLTIENYRVRDSSSPPATMLPAIDLAAGTINDCSISNSGMSRNNATDCVFARVSGSAIGRLSLSNVGTMRTTNVLSLTGGSVTSLTTSNVTHRSPNTSGAAGGAMINLSASATVTNATHCGSDTALLYGTSAGTPTSKKTDGTERGA